MHTLIFERLWKLMAHRLIRIRRPEGGEDHDAVLIVHHGCPVGKALSKEEPGVDAVLFPYGVVGDGMPSGVPFEVMSANPCRACDTYLRAWFEWIGPTVILPALWTPDNG